MRLLMVFLKEPIPGKVKTRLASTVGDDEAARRYKALVEVLLRQLQGLENCRIRFCYAPDDADGAIRFWLLPQMNASSSDKENIYIAPTALGDKYRQEIDFRPQGDGNLGDRMQRAFAEGFTDGFEKIAVIGTDCPDCGARWINTGFSKMAKDTSHGMIGPSTDGGYYMLGLKAPCPTVFENIAWSESSVFDATITAAETAGFHLETLPALTDIDHEDDWGKLLEGSLGAALKKALGEELDSPDGICL